MALEEFDQEPLSARDKGIIRMRTITNYGMGAFWIIAGFAFMFPNRYTRAFIQQYDIALIQLFAVVCWIYGLFRIYRGYQKNYFKD